MKVLLLFVAVTLFYGDTCIASRCTCTDRNCYPKHIPVYVYEKRVPIPFFARDAFKSPFRLPNPAPAINRAMSPGILTPVATTIGMGPVHPMIDMGIAGY